MVGAAIGPIGMLGIVGVGVGPVGGLDIGPITEGLDIGPVLREPGIGLVAGRGVEGVGIAPV